MSRSAYFHVGIVVPAKMVAETLAQCGERGVPFATIFTSNFSESGSERGRALQDEIKAVAARGNVRFMGPNCKIGRAHV